MFFKQKAYGRFLLKSTNQYGVHSPFVYQYLINCLYKRKKHPAYPKIKKRYFEYRNKKKYSVRYKDLKILNRSMRYFEVEKVWDLSDSNGLIGFAIAEGNPIESESISLKKDFETSEAFLKMKKDLAASAQEKHCIYLGNPSLDFSIKQIFDRLLPSLQNQSMLVLEGIHRSAEAERDWEEIKMNDQVRVSIDLFFMALVFFKKGQAKQHFMIRS